MQTCGYYDAFRGSKTSFSVVSATWHLAPCPPAACAIAHGSGAGDRSPKRPHKYARWLVRMVFHALCHRGVHDTSIIRIGACYRCYVLTTRARGRRALSVCTHSAHGTAGLALLSLPAATSPHAAPWTCRTCPSCAYSMIPDPVHAHDPRSNTLASATLGPLNSLRCQRASQRCPRCASSDGSARLRQLYLIHSRSRGRLQCTA